MDSALSGTLTSHLKKSCSKLYSFAAIVKMANWKETVHWNVGEGLIDFTSRCLLCENSAPIIYKGLCLPPPCLKLRDVLFLFSFTP